MMMTPGTKPALSAKVPELDRVIDPDHAVRNMNLIEHVAVLEQFQESASKEWQPSELL